MKSSFLLLFIFIVVSNGTMLKKIEKDEEIKVNFVEKVLEQKKYYPRSAVISWSPFNVHGVGNPFEFLYTPNFSETYLKFLLKKNESKLMYVEHHVIEIFESGGRRSIMVTKNEYQVNFKREEEEIEVDLKSIGNLKFKGKGCHEFKHENLKSQGLFICLNCEPKFKERRASYGTQERNLISCI